MSRRHFDEDALLLDDDVFGDPSGSSADDGDGDADRDKAASFSAGHHAGGSGARPKAHATPLMSPLRSSGASVEGSIDGPEYRELREGRNRRTYDAMAAVDRAAADVAMRRSGSGRGGRAVDSTTAAATRIQSLARRASARNVFTQKLLAKFEAEEEERERRQLAQVQEGLALLDSVQLAREHEEDDILAHAEHQTVERSAYEIQRVFRNHLMRRGGKLSEIEKRRPSMMVEGGADARGVAGVSRTTEMLKLLQRTSSQDLPERPHTSAGLRDTGPFAANGRHQLSRSGSGRWRDSPEGRKRFREGPPHWFERKADAAAADFAAGAGGRGPRRIGSSGGRRSGTGARSRGAVPGESTDGLGDVEPPGGDRRGRGQAPGLISINEWASTESLDAGPASASGAATGSAAARPVTPDRSWARSAHERPATSFARVRQSAGPSRGPGGGRDDLFGGRGGGSGSGGSGSGSGSADAGGDTFWNTFGGGAAGEAAQASVPSRRGGGASSGSGSGSARDVPAVGEPKPHSAPRGRLSKSKGKPAPSLRNITIPAEAEPIPRRRHRTPDRSRSRK